MSGAEGGNGLISTQLQLAVEHHQNGRLSAAEALYRQVIQSIPNQADALHLLGCIHSQQGNLESAVALIGQAIKAEPARENYHFSLGNALLAQGRLDEAATCYRQALSLKSDYAEAFSNLGNVFLAQGLLDDAIASFRQALRIAPGYAEVHCNLGNALKDQGRMDEAAASYRQALTFKPDHADAYSNLGNVLQVQGRLEDAVACLRQALLIQPDFVDAHFNLGNVFKDQARFDEAISCYRQALLLKPDFVEAYNNLGDVLRSQGALDKAEACFRQAFSIKPDYTDAYSNLIFTLDLAMGVDTATLQAERQRWDAACAAPLYKSAAFGNDVDPERRLRIGYVSADFREHSAAVVFGAMLTRFDPAAYEVFAYSNSTREDSQTRLFQGSVTGWRKIAGLSDDMVADLIRQDRIDILVDLSAHSSGHRLLVFARKPAPIQITAWGYAGGTGMKAMDVFFADPVVVPPEEKAMYAEEVRYLPNVVSAFFPKPFPEVSALPAQSDLVAKGEGVTFGSFNRLCKVTAETYQAWTQILLAVPLSRMVLKAHELDDDEVRGCALGYFTQAGIDPARITLLGRSSWLDHVTRFNQIDISLDPFPHGGGVTALEGLMMGVPVITLRWPTLPGRLSASILTTLGLTDWIAETQAQYVGIAVQKAQDLTALAELRQQLRPRFMASIIGDTAAYARAVESEYRRLWREWCSSQRLSQR